LLALTISATDRLTSPARLSYKPVLRLVSAFLKHIVLPLKLQKVNHDLHFFRRWSSPSSGMVRRAQALDGSGADFAASGRADYG
jgi:hypothetical protein